MELVVGNENYDWTEFKNVSVILLCRYLYGIPECHFCMLGKKCLAASLLSFLTFFGKNSFNECDSCKRGLIGCWCG